MYYIWSKGTPFEVGRNHGKKLSVEIQRAVVDWNVENWLGENSSECLERVKEYMLANAPNVIKELEGIADGAKMDYDTIFNLSAFNALSFVKSLSSCSVFAVPKPEGSGCLANTVDITSLQQRWELVHHIKYEGGMELIRISSVGSVWTTAGMNSYGVAIGSASAPIFSPQDGRGIPQHISATPVLNQAESTEDAIRLFREMRLIGKGMNFVLADSKGNCAIVEKSYDRQAERRGKQGVAVWATNHFVEQATQGHDLRDPERDYNSRGRYVALERLLNEEVDKNVVERLKDIVCTPDGNAPICRPNTLTAVIADTGSKRLWISPGRPTKDNFICFSLGDS